MYYIIKDLVEDLENVVQRRDHSVQEQCLDVKIEEFLSSYCKFDTYLIYYFESIYNIAKTQHRLPRFLKGINVHYFENSKPWMISEVSKAM